VKLIEKGAAAGIGESLKNIVVHWIKLCNQMVA
jgi:hypothetical protein